MAKRQAQALPFVAEAQVPVTVPGSQSVFKNICCMDECGYVACSRICLHIQFQSPSEFPSGFLRICSALLYGGITRSNDTCKEADFSVTGGTYSQPALSREGLMHLRRSS